MLARRHELERQALDDLFLQTDLRPIDAEIETAAMTKLRTESHARMLGNGLCTRPVELDCRMESACETCAYFHTDTTFTPVLLRQRDHARHHHQPDRAAIFDTLLDRVAGQGA